MIEQVHDNLLASDDHRTDPEEHHDQERKTHNVIGTSNWCVKYEAEGDVSDNNNHHCHQRN